MKRKGAVASALAALARFPRPALVALFALSALTALSASSGCDSPTDPQIQLQQPPQTGDGWETASLQDVGLNPSPLQGLLDRIGSTRNHRIHSLLMVKDKRLVFERYWPGTDLNPVGLAPVHRDFDRETLHYVASVSKSVTSDLAGIAVDRGLIGTVEESIFDHFPEHADLETEETGGITLKHLLSFTSGFHWNEFVYGFDDPRDSHNMMFASEDPIRHLLSRPMETDPGAVFHYNSGDTNLLGEVVRRASSSSTLVDFAVENLFDPLGIDTFGWVRFGPGGQLAFASGGVSLRPRDMAKVGALHLNGGTWNGVRILSQAWVDESTDVAIPFVGNNGTLSGPLYGYGYNWWLGRFSFGGTTVDYFRAAGWGGQDIFVIPALEMVIVFTAGAFYESPPLNVNDLIQDYILQAAGG